MTPAWIPHDITIITPSRPGERTELLERCKFYVARQTVKCHHIIVDYPMGSSTDITRRYRAGLTYAAALGSKLAIVMEDDDYYAPDYVAHCHSKWMLYGMPSIMGEHATTYYNVATQCYKILPHPGRASMMSTCIVPAAVKNLRWPPDTEKFTDIFMWQNLRGKSLPSSGKVLGIKGISGGLTGGIGHNPNFGNVKDLDFSYLRSLMPGEDSDFYESFKL